MLPICTWAVRMGQVLTLGVDMMNLLLSFCAALLLRVGSKGHKGLSLLPSKKKCFSIALRHTLVVLEMH